MSEILLSPAIERLLERLKRSDDDPEITPTFPCVSFVPAHEVAVDRAGLPLKPCGHCDGGSPRPAGRDPALPWPPPMAEGLVCACCHRAGEEVQRRCRAALARVAREKRARLANNKLTEATPVPPAVREADEAALAKARAKARAGKGGKVR